jgi:hypothetical protein
MEHIQNNLMILGGSLGNVPQKSINISEIYRVFITSFCETLRNILKLYFSVFSLMERHLVNLFFIIFFGNYLVNLPISLSYGIKVF